MSSKLEKKCSMKKCQGKATVGSMCAKHAADNDGPTKTVKLSELDFLKWKSLDTEIRNHMQALTLADYKMNELQNQVRLSIQNFQNEKKNIMAKLEAAKLEYKPLMDRLATDYLGIDSSNLSIDDMTGIVHDLSKPPKET